MRYRRVGTALRLPAATPGYCSAVEEQPPLFEVDPKPAPEDPGREPDAPLASRLPPRRFEDLVGQREVGDPLRSLAGPGRLPSPALWGPPGSGKTTLAGILAEATGARFVSLSAVTAGVADLRRVVAEAAQARRRGVRTR